MSIVIGGSSSGGSRNLVPGWNMASFKGAELSQDANGKDYLKVVFVIDGNDVPLFQSEPSIGGYAGIKTLQKIVNGYVNMYKEVSRPAILDDDTTPLWNEKCAAFEQLIGDVFNDYNDADYKNMSETEQKALLGNYFIDASCKAFCDEGIDNILSYKGVEGKVLCHYVYNKSKNAWFLNIPKFEQVLTHVYDENGEKKRNKGYYVGVEYTPFTTDTDDVVMAITPNLIQDKYGINFVKEAHEATSTPATTPTPDNTTNMANW